MSPQGALGALLSGRGHCSLQWWLHGKMSGECTRAGSGRHTEGGRAHARVLLVLPCWYWPPKIARGQPRGAAWWSWKAEDSPALHDLQAEVQQPCQGLGNHPPRAVILHRVGGHHFMPSWVWVLIFVHWTWTAHSFPRRVARAGAVLYVCLPLAARLGSLLHSGLPPRPGRLAGRLPQPALVLGVVAKPSLRGRQQNDCVPNPARRGRRLAARAGAPGAPRVCGARSRPAAPGAPAAPPPSWLLALVLLTSCSAALPTSLAHSGRLLPVCLPRQPPPVPLPF